MKNFAELIPPQSRSVIIGLVAASAIGTALIFCRAWFISSGRNLFLVGNLFLAWMPLFIALLVERRLRDRTMPDWRTWLLLSAWLLFLPNAAYIFTDLIHLFRHAPPRFWIDLPLLLTFAVTGFVAGFVSLHRMQSLLRDRAGEITGWLFVGAVSPLVGFGVYLGRFERWNTWDVVVSPLAFAMDSLSWFHYAALKFSLVFGAFHFAAYLALYSVTLLGKESKLTPVPRVSAW